MAKGIRDPKVLKKKKVTFYLQPWVARKLKYVSNQSALAEESIIKHNGWTRPGPAKDEK